MTAVNVILLNIIGVFLEEEIVFFFIKYNYYQLNKVLFVSRGGRSGKGVREVFFRF